MVLQREGEGIKRERERERNKESVGEEESESLQPVGVYLTTSVYTALSNHTPVI